MIAIGNAIGINFGSGGVDVTDWGNWEFGNEQGLCTADALINAAQPTYNYGATTVFAVGEYNSAVGTITRSLLKFDLSSIPADAVILSASLNIYRVTDLSTNSRTIKVFRVKRNWTEGTGNGSATGDGATWNTYNGTDNWETAGGFGANDCEQTEIGSKALDAVESAAYKVIPLTATALTDLDLGYGLLLKVDTEADDAYTYHHRGDETRYPFLRVKYRNLINGTVSSFFAKSASNPFMTGKYFGSVVYNGANDYVFFSSDKTNVKRDISSNGTTWTGDQTVMTPAAGTIDVCQAWKEGSTWYMLYRSNEWGGSQSIGLATSADGITWNKSASNPVIENTDIGAWCTGNIDPFGIIKVGSTYYLWVNDVGEVPRQTGLMTSTDLVNWTPDANNPIFDNGRYCVCPIKYNNKYYLFVPYTPSGNVEGADQWNYRIELYRDSDPMFLSGSREYLGVILISGDATDFDYEYIDTPSILTGTIERDTFPTGDIRMYWSGQGALAVWKFGLAIGDLDMIDQLTAITEPSAGE